MLALAGGVLVCILVNTPLHPSQEGNIALARLQNFTSSQGLATRTLRRMPNITYYF
jgi:hypothetical protein